MRIIPKKIKVKNTIFKCYSLVDIIVALVIFILVFVFLTVKKYVLSALLGLGSVILLMPTGDGIFYTIILENLKFILKNKEFSKYYKDKKSIDNIITYKDIKDNGVILYKNGTYARVLKIGQKSFGLEDEETQNIDINYISNAMKELELDSIMDIVKIDRPVNLDTFSKDLFNKISNTDDEIKEELLNERIDQIDNLNNISKKYISYYYIVVYSKDEVLLETQSINISLEISKAGLDVQILEKEDVALYLKYSISNNFDERDINKEDLLDWITPNNISFSSKEIKVDGVSSSIFGISDYPLKVKNAWGSGLFNIPNTKVCLRLKPVEKSQAIKRIDKCINEMETKKLLSEKASESNVATTHMDTMQVLLDGLQTENESLFDVTITVTAYNYDNNPNYKKEVKRAINVQNFKSSPLYGNQIDAFISSNNNPLWNINKLKRGINSSTLAAIFPFTKTIVLEEDGDFLGETTSNNPFILNIWKRGNLYQNSNAMVIGKSGSGKSFFLKNLILSEWSNGVNVIVLDPEAEYINLTKNLNGTSIDVGKFLEGRINPFHIYKVLTEEGKEANYDITFNTHLKTLESFFKITLNGASSEIVELINNVVISTYERLNLINVENLSSIKPTDFPTFSDVMETINIMLNDDNIDMFKKHNLQTAQLYLEKFTNGRYSDIWNGPSTLSLDSSIIDFNFQTLFANKNNVVANAQMLLIFRFIEGMIINNREANKSNKKVKTLVVCDEAHMFIDAKYPIALDFFYSMSKRIRKYDGAFIPATQNIADWNANEELRSKTSAIIKNSQYMFIFKLSAPDMKDLLDIFGKGANFNEDEQRLIISAVTGQCFYIGSTELRTSMKVLSTSKYKKFMGEKDYE